MSKIEKINFLEGGNKFTETSGWSSYHYTEISEEEYNRIKSIENWKNELNDYAKSHLAPAIEWGYGFYGVFLASIDDHYYYCMKTGSSCD